MAPSLTCVGDAVEGVSPAMDGESFRLACRDGGRRIERWLREFDARYGPALYREAAGVLQHLGAAEDLVQDTLIKVWQRCASFRAEGHPFAWVRQILRHALLDTLRARTPEEPLEDETGEFTPAVQVAVNHLSADRVTQPDAEHEARVLEAMYQRCYARFAAAHPEHAQVLRWVAEDGLGPAEVAALLGRSPGATREFLSQCRKKARPFLAEWHALVSHQSEASSGGSNAGDPR